MSIQTALIPLYSSSRGNSTLVCINDTYILIDCGMSCKKITEALVGCEVCPDDISALFLTHGHADHISGVEIFAKKYHTPIYCTEGTVLKLHDIKSTITIIEENEIVSIGDDVEVRAFPTPHDISGSVCYKVLNKTTDAAVSIMTDLGNFNDGMKGFARGSDAILLESNYDCEMLRTGPYPYPLQQRISGGHGHISNVECANTADYLIRNGTRKFVLGHLSPNNNTEELALSSFINILSGNGFARNRDYEVQVASKIHSSEGYTL